MSVALLASTAAAQQAPASGPRDLLQKLNALRVDAAEVYRVRELYLRRDAVRVALDEGKLAFLAAQDGRVTGAVFTGQGRVIAMPRDPVEKRSLARFLGAPLLDETFSRAYFRFTDDTAEELRVQLSRAGARPFAEPSFAEDWNTVVANLNPRHSLRILADLLANAPQPYFYAGIAGDTSGAFDVLVNNRREEQILIGQMRFAEGVRYYDTWASFPREEGPAPEAPFVPLGYAIETTIHPENTLEGTTTVQLKAARGGERLIPLELSWRLTVSDVTDDAGRALPFFQNGEVAPEEMLLRGNDAVFIVLPQIPAAGETIRLRIAYRGSVISDAGNDVLFVGERGSWYPHISGADHFVPFELAFRWPRRLTLVATGKKLEEREEGDWRAGKWKSEAPIPVAGFNLGEYVTGRVETGTWKIELYANLQFEQAVLERFNKPVVEGPPVRTRSGVPAPPRIIWPDPPPSPAALMNPVGEDLAEAIRFYEKLIGPFPFERLAVAQIPGSFGQDWPGLLYLSTLSFLTPAEQSRAGIGRHTQEHFSELVPVHKVAHQWWGGAVGWSSYRDQWIQEGLANYLALMFAEDKRPGELAAWLETYRSELSTKEGGAEETPGEMGPLALGYRLRSSKSPRAYAQLVYPKSAWVFHMLRMMLRESGAAETKKPGASKTPKAAKDPDAHFAQLLQALLANYRHRALSTADLQREVEKVMTPEMDLEGSKKTPGRPGAMDWFFDQWVRGTGIPKYSVEFDVKPAGERFIVRGKLRQSGVPVSFIAPVPIYEPRAPGGKPVLLGTVVTNGEETPFQFTVRTAPKKLLIDPNRTLLCLTD
ncbi:MAG: hypothetical protein HYR59_05130 [Acidobacteria bacterium]|nr:hypothetical protein [Acidobacteriota bacterium]